MWLHWLKPIPIVYNCLFNVCYFVSLQKIKWGSCLIAPMEAMSVSDRNFLSKFSKYLCIVPIVKPRNVVSWIYVPVCIVICKCHVEILVKLLCYSKIGISIICLKSVKKPVFFKIPTKMMHKCNMWFWLSTSSLLRPEILAYLFLKYL